MRENNMDENEAMSMSAKADEEVVLEEQDKKSDIEVILDNADENADEEVILEGRDEKSDEEIISEDANKDVDEEAILEESDEKVDEEVMDETKVIISEESNSFSNTNCDNMQIGTNASTQINNEEIVQALGGIETQIYELKNLFNSKIMHTQHEEKIVDQMHRELQKYKDDLYSQLVRPVLLDIIDIRDSILRVADVYMKKTEGEQAIPNKTFTGYAYEIQDILEKNNIEVYQSKEGEKFVPIKHRVVKKIETPIEGLHGKIAQSMSDGYNYNGKTISAEKVTIYCYSKPIK